MEVKGIGRHGVVVKSVNLEWVSQLFCCSTFGGLSVRAFIPPHLIRVKGVIRGVNSSADAAEALD